MCWPMSIFGTLHTPHGSTRTMYHFYKSTWGTGKKLLTVLATLNGTITSFTRTPLDIIVALDKVLRDQRHIQAIITWENSE